MNITEQITNSLKQAIDNNTTIDFVYIKLTKEHVSCWSNSILDSCYCINVKDYMNGYECFLDDIGYLTYHSNIYSHFFVSLATLMYNQNYSDIITKVIISIYLLNYTFKTIN